MEWGASQVISAAWSYFRVVIIIIIIIHSSMYDVHMYKKLQNHENIIFIILTKLKKTVRHLTWKCKEECFVTVLVSVSHDLILCV